VVQLRVLATAEGRLRADEHSGAAVDGLLGWQATAAPGADGRLSPIVLAGWAAAWAALVCARAAPTSVAAVALRYSLAFWPRCLLRVP
jgi:hypothetical protein